MNPESSERKTKVIGIAAIVSIVILFIGWLFGHWGPALITNEKCYRLLGCNIGFFGYDAVLHFISGIMDALIVIWLMRRFPSLSLFHAHFWKNFLVIIRGADFLAALPRWPCRKVWKPSVSILN